MNKIVLTIALLAMLALSVPAQSKKLKWGGVHVGLNRTAPISSPVRTDRLRRYNVSVMGMVLFKPRKRTYSFQVQVIRSFSNGPTLLRVGVSTRIF